MFTLQGYDKEPNPDALSMRKVNVSIDGSGGFELMNVVPFAEAPAGIEAWLNANVPAETAANWKHMVNGTGPHSDRKASNAKVREGWRHETFTKAAVDPYMRAFSELVLDELNALRTAAALPVRTEGQFWSAMKAKLDA